ncbi:MAG: cysteine desulfurase NifS [Desulfovibrionales bacterium]
MQTIYMDNNATTEIDPVVLEAMMPYLTQKYGNPSSMHSFGGQIGMEIKGAREQVAGLLGCHPDEIIFTASGTEGDNTAIRSALEANPDKRHIVTTRVEHPAVLALCTYLEKKKGYDVTYLSVDSDGMLDMAEVEASLRPDTAVVSVMWANNETGNIYPVEEIGGLARSRGILFHTDAVQTVGKLPVSVSDMPVDMLTISGHKIHAPKGVGALYVRRTIPFRPFLIGGHQEKGRRAGTENTASIIGLGKACEQAGKTMVDENTRVKGLRDKLQQGLVKNIPEARLNGHPDKRLPNTANISFKYVEGEAILLMIDQLGICASSGSACTSGSLEPSHVLRAMGVPFTFAHGSIRFSLSRFNTEEEVDFVVEHFPKIISTLRQISPYSQATEGTSPECRVT